MIGVRQPGVKRKQRHLHREANKNSGKGEPGEVSREQPALSKTRQSREIERALREINPEERKQHGDASEKCVEEKLRRGAIAIFTAPDFDQQKTRDQTHFVEQEPENEILRGERAVERGLHDQHESRKTRGFHRERVAREMRME